MISVLKGTITSDGVWRIRRRERSPVIEVFRMEEAGHGDILSDEFINWRFGGRVTFQHHDLLSDNLNDNLKLATCQ